VPQVKARLSRVRAPLLYVANIMTEAGETDGMDVYAHASALYDHVGRWPDVILVNDRPVDEPRLASYRDEAADVVAVDFAALDRVGVRVIAADLLADGRYAQHDSARLAEVVLRVATAVRDGEVLA